MRAFSLFLSAPLAHHALAWETRGQGTAAPPVGPLVGRSVVPCLGLPASNGLALLLSAEERGKTLSEEKT